MNISFRQYTTTGLLLAMLLFVSVARADRSASPLLVAVAQSDVIRVKTLLAKGADVNAKNEDGVTPLYAAAALGQKEIVEMLLANKADVNVKDNDGTTPLRLAVMMGHREVVDVIQNYLAKTKRAQTPREPSQQAEVAPRQTRDAEKQSSAILAANIPAQ